MDNKLEVVEQAMLIGELHGPKAALTALREAGYAVVPVKPTEAMLEAGEIGLADAGVDGPNTNDARECFAAMIQAVQEQE